MFNTTHIAKAQGMLRKWGEYFTLQVPEDQDVSCEMVSSICNRKNNTNEMATMWLQVDVPTRALCLDEELWTTVGHTEGVGLLEG